MKRSPRLLRIVKSSNTIRGNNKKAAGPKQTRGFIETIYAN
jgi:hypothetical protein